MQVKCQIIDVHEEGVQIMDAPFQAQSISPPERTYLFQTIHGEIRISIDEVAERRVNDGDGWLRPMQEEAMLQILEGDDISIEIDRSTAKLNVKSCYAMPREHLYPFEFEVRGKEPV